MEYSNYKYASSSKATYNEGLRSFMISVFNNMFIGLIISAISSIIGYYNTELFYGKDGMTTLGTFITFSPLVFIFAFSALVKTVSANTARILMFTFTGLLGLSLSYIFNIYTIESITNTFFVTAALFGSMSLYGYNTKKDLTSMGSFMLMGVFGVFIASIVNLFLQSSSVSFAISIISVISFTGLTAWDVKVLKNYYLLADDEEDRKKAAVVGSLNIYMNFINIFLSLLRLFGDRKN
jgi:hypothetical protein